MSEPFTVIDPALSDLEAQQRGRIAELAAKYPVPVLTSDPMWVTKKSQPSSLNTNKNKPRS